MTWNSSAIAHLNARQGVMPRWLLWVETRNLSTNDPEPVGVWNGDDDQSFTIAGVNRLYRGAQSMFGMESIVYAAGTNVRTKTITLSGIDPRTEIIVRGYKVKYVPADLYLGLFDPDSGSLIDTKRMFKGFVNRAPIFTPALGGGSTTIKLELASSIRTLTRTLGLKKSDQSQQLRSGDRFRRYGSLSGTITTRWGE